MLFLLVLSTPVKCSSEHYIDGIIFEISDVLCTTQVLCIDVKVKHGMSIQDKETKESSRVVSDVSVLLSLLNVSKAVP